MAGLISISGLVSHGVLLFYHINMPCLLIYPYPSCQTRPFMSDLVSHGVLLLLYSWKMFEKAQVNHQYIDIQDPVLKFMEKWKIFREK